MTAFRPRSLVIGAVGLLALCLALAVWAVLIEPGRLVVKEVELSLPSWPREMPPLTIAVVADLHTGAPHVGPENVKHLVEQGYRYLMAAPTRRYDALDEGMRLAGRA